MIKNLSFILIAVFFVGCTSDNADNQNEEQNENQEENVELVLQRYTHTTFNQFPDPEAIIIDFNQNGTIDRYKFEVHTGVPTGYFKYEYNSNGTINRIDHYTDSGDFEETVMEYTFDSQGRLTQFIDYGSQGGIGQTTNFTYDGNTVNFEEVETGKTGYVIFDSQGKILETNHNSGPEQFTRSVLTYDAKGLLIEVYNFVSDNLSYTMTIDYDSNINPLFQMYSGDPLVYISPGIHDIDFTGTFNPFSANNVTRNAIPGLENRIDETTYEYNAEGYPTMGTTLRNGELRTEHKFEY